jgi:hypothetical protein
MAWESKYTNFGVVKIDGDKIYVYYDQNNKTTIYAHQKVISANWAGGELNVSMSDGKVRRYRDSNNYITI